METETDSAATMRALVQVRPGADGVLYIDKERHPHLHAYAVQARRVSVAPGLWRQAYRRFGDEMEGTLAAVSSRHEYRSVTKAFVEALPDPWMVTGHTSEELGTDFFLLWNLLYTRDMSQALVLVDSPVPRRARELAAWVGRLTVPQYSRGGTLFSDAPQYVTWENTFGRSLRYLREEIAEASDPFMYTVTEADLCEFMDSGIRPSRDTSAGSLQEQLAVLRGTFSRERQALAEVHISYGPAQNADYPFATQFVQNADSDTTVEIEVDSVDLAEFEAVLEGTHGFGLEASRERLAYGLDDVSDLYGGPLAPGQQRMWEVVVQYSEEPQDWFASVLGTEASLEDTETVITWMGKHCRPHVAWFYSKSWLDFVLLPPSSKDVWFRSAPVPLDAEAMPLLCSLISAGATFEQVMALYREQGLTLAEMNEVLVHGVPVEYVLALRVDSEPPPF